MLVSLFSTSQKNLWLGLALMLGWSASGKDVVQPLAIEEIHALVEKLVNYSPDSSLLLLDVASDRIGALKNKNEALAYTAENNLRRADYWVFKSNKKSREYLNKAHGYYKQHTNNRKLAEIYTLRAQIAKGNTKTQHSINEATPYLDTALSFALMQDNHTIIAFIYYEKAISLQQAERWQESFENAFLSMEQAELSKDSLSMAAAYFLMGRTYNYFSLFEYSESYLSKSIAYGKGVFHISSIIHIYADMLLQNGKTEEALKNYQRVLSIFLQQNLTSSAITVYSKIGQNQLRAGKYQSAESTYQAMSNLISDSIEIGPRASVFSAHMQHYFGYSQKAVMELNSFKNKFTQTKFRTLGIDMFKDVADLYSTLGESEQAAVFYLKWGTLKDSLHIYSSRIQLSELEKMYLNERQINEEIIRKNKELNTSRTQQAAMGGVLILILLLAGGSAYYIRMRGVRENQALKFALKEKQLKQLMEGQETERQRLARELHDGIGQSLAALKMQIQLNDDAQAKEIIVKTVEALCKEVRSISHQMMPLVLEQNGLLCAVEQLVDHSFLKADMEVDFVSHGLYGRLPIHIEVHLYRIVQELTTNILKHSKATKIGVQLLKRKDVLLLIVEDNGCGFNSEEESSGIGLANIQSRLEALSGNVKIQSSGIEGTYVRIAVPLFAIKERKTA